MTGTSIIAKIFVPLSTKCRSFMQGNLNTHAREPLYSNNAVNVGWLQSTRAQNILFWFTLIHSLSNFFTTINFHDVFIRSYHLGIFRL